MSTSLDPVDQPSAQNRRPVVQALTLGFVLLSMATRSWDDLVSHVALGIAIGLAIAAFIFAPPRRSARRNPNTVGSTPKTILFWVMLLAAAILIYQTVRGPR